MAVEARNGSKPAKFTAYSLLFTVPEASAKHRDSCKPLREPKLREIIRRSHQPIRKNSLLISLFLRLNQLQHPFTQRTLRTQRKAAFGNSQGQPQAPSAELRMTTATPFTVLSA